MKKLIFAAVTLLLIIGIFFGFYLKSSYVFPVVMYHSIDNQDKITKLSVCPVSFENQVEFLHGHNYNVLKLEDALPFIKNKMRVPPRTLAITFDDGFLNNYECAYPLLKRYNIPATIFIIVGKVGKPGYMTWDQIREMSDSGVITIGSHTMSHLWLPSMSDKKLRYELEESKRILEKKLGKPVNTLCYPVGAFDKRVQDAVRAAGYTCAVTTNPGGRHPADDIYAIKRIKISRTSDNLFVFWVETSGFYTWIKEHRDDD